MHDLEMGESFETQLLRSDHELPCPSCSYPVWVRLSEIVVQTTVLCPCCRVKIKLIDGNASAATIGRRIELMVSEILSDL